MNLEQKEPTKDLKGRTADVLSILPQLKYMPRYPDDDKTLLFISGVLARFIQTVEVNHVGCPDPKFDLGWVNPLNLLMQEVAATCTRFPPPIVMRKMYEALGFTPLDGKTSSALEEVLE